jgi:hypothetical protein
MQVNKLIYIALGLLISGCSSTDNSGPWRASVTADRFTDEVECFVSVAEYWGGDYLYTRQNHYYPYIQKKDGQLRVGLRSGGKFPIPVGDVKMRIDQNKAWDITVSETPADLKSIGSAMSPDYVNTLTANMDQKTKDMVESTIKNQQQYTAQMLSTFTAATDSKAEQILKELLSGKNMIYQTGGLPGLKSTVGEVQLNSSLQKALSDCGIK